MSPIEGDYRPALLRSLPWLDRELVTRILAVVAERGPFKNGFVRSPDFGDASLPIPPAFLPLVLNGTYSPIGIFGRDPRTSDGAIFGIQLEDAFAVHFGRTGKRFGVELLASLVSDEEARTFADAVFPSASSAERDAWIQLRESGDPLLELATMKEYLRDDDESDPRALDRAGWGQWSFDAIPPPSLPGERAASFDDALAKGDMLTAWAVLNSPGWSHDEVQRAWARIAPLVDPSLRDVLEAKLESFPFEDGY
jgi:hypothetical protein